VALISFDDTPIIRLAHPPITAIVQPIAEVTARAVSLIIADLGGRSTENEPVVVPAQLIARKSTSMPGS
jgi:LacI family transcriptional regulator